MPPGKTPQAYLEELAWEHAAQHYPEGVPDKVRALLVKELALIARLDYARYFLTVYDVVRFARSRDILCQGRGSAANSAVCFVLGITSVNPTEVDLLFERFISADRGEPPDIDVDFEHERREEVIQYLYARYGRERAAICATVIHYRPRMAIREVGKAMGLKEDVTAGLSGLIWGTGDGDIPEAHIREAGLDPANPELRQAIALARQLLGFPRHLSQHVGGFVLTRERLDETVPVLNAAMEERTNIEWDKDDIDALGMLKVDVLALGMLTCIRKSLRADRAPLRPRAHAGERAARGPRRLRDAVPRRFRRRVPGRKPRPDVDAAAPAAAHASTISSSRSPSCVPAPSRATWCTPICAGATASSR